jgi:hypothetical protein
VSKIGEASPQESQVSEQMRVEMEEVLDSKDTKELAPRNEMLFTIIPPRLYFQVLYSDGINITPMIPITTIPCPHLEPPYPSQP